MNISPVFIFLEIPKVICVFNFIEKNIRLLPSIAMLFIAIVLLGYVLYMMHSGASSSGNGGDGNGGANGNGNDDDRLKKLIEDSARRYAKQAYKKELRARKKAERFIDIKIPDYKEPYTRATGPVDKPPFKF